MDLEEILDYIAQLEGIDIETVVSQYEFGLYDEFIEQYDKEYNG